MATEKQLMTDGVEEEQLYPEAYEKEIVEPFNPKDVDIVSQPMVVSNIIDQLKYDDILLEPDFQRHPDLWNPKQQSRLIESLVIRIPLPTFYFDSTGDDKLIVVDGLQRLYAIKRFMVLDKEDPDRLRLTDLEYLSEYEGKIFEELPANIQRRIKAQTLTAYVIRPGTPDKVRTSIFTRINTGGLILEPAEIKNSVYRGQAANLLKELAHSEEFIKATRNKIDSSRMLDCEFVNRFLAFYLLGIDQYPGNLEDYLNTVMSRLQTESEHTLEICRRNFLKAMKYASGIFGDTAFRKINVSLLFGTVLLSAVLDVSLFVLGISPFVSGISPIAFGLFPIVFDVFSINTALSSPRSPNRRKKISTFPSLPTSIFWIICLNCSLVIW